MVITSKYGSCTMRLTKIEAYQVSAHGETNYT